MASHSIASLFNDKATSDFTIKCSEHRFHVHKLILSHRSATFKAMLSNSAFAENSTNEMDVTVPSKQDGVQSPPEWLHENSPPVIYAFFYALYADDYPSLGECLERLAQHEDGIEHQVAKTWITHEDREALFDERISELANQYLVKGLDTVVARKLFGGDGRGPRILRMGKNGVIPLDDATRVLATVFRNASWSDCPAAQAMIAAFVVDNTYLLKSVPAAVEKLILMPGVAEAMCREMFNGVVRIECPFCGTIMRKHAENLNAGPCCITDKWTDAEYGQALRQDGSSWCSVCDKSFETLWGLKRWTEGRD